MSAKAAGIVLGTIYAALFFIILVGSNSRRIAHAYEVWQLKSDLWEQPRDATAGRDEEEGLPAGRRQPPQPAPRPPAPMPRGITITAPQPMNPAAVAHNPLTPAIYVIPPPPELHPLPPPSPWQPAVPRKPLLRLPRPPQPMLPSPPPLPSPIPLHHRHLVPDPLQVGPYHREFYQKPKCMPVKLSEILEANAKDDDILATQQQQQQQQNDSNAVPEDSNNARTTYLSPGCILRDSTGSTSTSSTSTDRDTTPSESPRIMEARARTVKLVSQMPDRQHLQVEIVLVGAAPSKEMKQPGEQSLLQTGAATAASGAEPDNGCQNANDG